MQHSGIVGRFGIFLGTLYVASGFGLFLSVADNSMRKGGKLPLPPTICAVIFLLSILLFAVLRDFISKRPSENLSTLFRANLGVIFPFAFLAFLSLTLALHPTAYWGDGRKWIYLQTYDFFIFLSAMLLPSVEFIRRRFQFFVIVGLLTILGSIWYEVQYPGTFSSVPNRAAGFPGNSNWGALVTVMICSMSLRYKDGPSRILDLVILGLTGIGLYFTFSRSGSINFVQLLCFYLAVAVLTSENRAKTVFSLGVAASLLISFFIVAIPFLSGGSALMSGESSSKTQNRLLALIDGELVDDGSAADRMEAARETLDMIERSPVLGHGTGFNRKMRQTPHNLYLKLWVDSGIFGLMTWLTLLGSGMWVFTSRRYRPGQALVLVTFLGSFFSHNILEQRTFLILFGTAAAMSLYESGRLGARTNLRRVAAVPMQQYSRPVPSEA